MGGIFADEEDAGLSRVRVIFLSLLLLVGTTGTMQSQTKKPADPPKEIELRSTPGVWQPQAGGMQIALWPETMVLAKPDTGDHAEETGNGTALVGGRPWHWAGYVTRPTMTIYRPKGKNSGATMLVLPGGGFAAVAMDLEGTEICDWVVQQGMTCVILKYRAPQQWPLKANKSGRQRPEILLALEDAQRAMGLLQHNAAAYGIDPNKIGVIGFSAGAYLAANMSNAEQLSYKAVDAADQGYSRPKFAIIAYTGRLWDKSHGKTELRLAPWVTISAKAPPTLLIHTMNDDVDDIRHPLAYALALNEVGVPVDLRIYAKGGHAYGLRPTKDPITTQWPKEAEQWLRDLGVL